MLSLGIFLNILLLIITLLSQESGPRLYYNFLYFGALSIIFLVGIAFVSNYISRRSVSEKNKLAFIVITTLYLIFFIAMMMVYLKRGQVIRIQSILFAFKVKTLTKIMLRIAVYSVAGIALMIAANKIFIINHIKTTEIYYSKIFFYGALFLLLGLTMFIGPSIGFKDPLIQSYNNGRPLLIEAKNTESDILFDYESKLNRPNVIFVLLESISAEKLGTYGYSRETTPNLDRLANMSTVFENAYTTATHSDYAQPAYLSSNYLLINSYRNLFSEKHDGLFPWGIFKNESYKTAYISSQDDSWAGMGNYYNYDSIDYYSYSLTDENYDYGSGLSKKDLDDKTIDKVLDWINQSTRSCRVVPLTNFSNTTYTVECSQNSETPFFLYTNLQATHKPWIFPDDKAYFSLDNESESDIIRNTNLYDDSLRYVDSQFGRLLDYLEVNGAINNTIIIVTSDHGDDIYGRHGSFGHGYGLYREETNVPLIFFFPDKIPSRISDLVSHIDVLPTVLEALDLRPENEFRGDLFNKNERIFFYIQNHKYMIGMIKDNMKIILDLNREITEVYDLEEDPLEANNLYRSYRYTEYILELLTWHHCQLNYFSVNEKDPDLVRYCEPFRNS